MFRKLGTLALFSIIVALVIGGAFLAGASTSADSNIVNNSVAVWSEISKPESLVGKTLYVSSELVDTMNPANEYTGDRMYVTGEPVKVLIEDFDYEGDVLVFVEFEDGASDWYDVSWFRTKP